MRSNQSNHSIKAVLYVNIQTCSSPSYSQEDPQNISCFSACLTALSCSCAALKIGNSDIKLKKLFEVMTKALIAFFQTRGFFCILTLKNKAWKHKSVVAQSPEFNPYFLRGLHTSPVLPVPLPNTASSL